MQLQVALALLVFVAPLLSTAVPARGEESKPGNAAALTIEEAIDTAKHCVLERNIQVAGSFIESAHFERNARGDRGPYWTVSWAHSREVKGGRVWITVYQNRTCEVRFGE